MRQVTIVKVLFGPTVLKPIVVIRRGRGGGCFYLHILVFILTLVAFCSRSLVAHDAVLFSNFPDHMEYTNVHFCNCCSICLFNKAIVFSFMTCKWCSRPIFMYEEKSVKSVLFVHIILLYVNIVTSIEVYLLEINIAKLSPLFSVVCFGS